MPKLTFVEQVRAIQEKMHWSDEDLLGHLMDYVAPMPSVVKYIKSVADDEQFYRQATPKE